MKKKLAIIFLFSLLFVSGSPIFAQSASPTATPTGTAASDKLDELKDRLATVVAELRQTQKRAIAGVIKSTSLTTAIIETKTKDLKIELIDELIVHQNISGKRTKLTVDDLETGDHVAVFGDYDTTLDLMKAKVVFIQTPLPVFVAGRIQAIDPKEFTLTIQSQEGPLYIVDFEKTTKTQKWTGGDTLAKGGFAQFAVDDIVHVAGSYVKGESNRITAQRILSIGNPTATPTPTTAPEATASATPSATASPNPSE
jgi:hypothetical protein